MKTNDSKIIVKINPELAELIPTFLKNRGTDIPTMLEALKTGDYIAIERTGHGMKGSGSGFGFDAISEIGGLIEEAAKQKNESEVKKGIEDFSNYMSRIEIIYE